ncbi:hypothetical protein OHS59_38380 [Streptomyces sp. NBC_00414]|uniref:hypothetical protein n=1 Tax=Streptomyces sp. NBC_00414 TaxID=2975739 RepID=UPI002E1B0022
MAKKRILATGALAVLLAGGITASAAAASARTAENSSVAAVPSMTQSAAPTDNGGVLRLAPWTMYAGYLTSVDCNIARERLGLEGVNGRTVETKCEYWSAHSNPYKLFYRYVD